MEYWDKFPMIIGEGQSDRIVPNQVDPSIAMKYAMVEDFYLQGGFRVCSGLTSSSINGRNSITYDRRKIGMMVYDIVGQKYWRLINEPEPEPATIDDYNPDCATLTTDSDWEEVVFSGASGLTFSALTYDTTTEILTIEFRDGNDDIVSGSTIIPMSPSGMTFSAITYDSVPSTVQVEFKIGAESITGETVLNYVNTGATTADLTWTNPFGLKIGGIPRGSTFPDSGRTMWQMWTDLLYPPQVGLWYVSPLSGTYPCEGTISNSITYYVTFSNWTGSLNWTVVNGDGGFYHITPPASGTSNGSFSVWCDPNPTGVIRTGHVNVFVSGETTPVQVTITQIPCTMNYDIQPTHQYFTCNSGTADYNITFSGTWLWPQNWTLVQDNSSTSWCSLSKYTGTGPDTVTATFSDNNTGLNRIAEFTLTASGHSSSRIAYLHHSPCLETPDFIVFPASRTVDYNSGFVYYSGKTLGTWSTPKTFTIVPTLSSTFITTNPNFYTISSGDDFAFTVNYSENTSPNTRYAYVDVTAVTLSPTITRSVELIQTPPPPVLGFNVVPPQHTYNCDGTNIDGDTFTVNLTGDWDTDGRPKNWWITNPYDAVWCTLNRTGGTAPTLTFTATCSSLTVGQPAREIDYYVAASGISYTQLVKVHQNMCNTPPAQYWFYWGYSNDIINTSEKITGLTNSLLITNGNITNVHFNLPSTAAKKYVWWCYKSDIGLSDGFYSWSTSNYYGSGVGDPGNPTNASYLNTAGKTMFYHLSNVTRDGNTYSYKVYRSAQQLNGPITSIINNLI